MHSMPAVMILVWSLDVVAQCAIWTIALVCTTGFPELGLYKFSWAMGKPITHLTRFNCWTYSYSLPKFSIFLMQLGKLRDIHHTAFLSSFFCLSRVTIAFSYCPQIAKASLHVGGQCLDIKQNMHSKSYINLHKLYKRKKKVMSKKKKKTTKTTTTKQCWD